MIQKLKLKFIALSLSSLFVLLAVIVTGMNLLNYRSVTDEADMTLSLLSRNHGTFPEFDKDKDKDKPEHAPPDMKHDISGMSPELPYESRFFSVLLNNAGGVVLTETDRIISVSAEEAAEYAEEVFRKGKESGFARNFRYIATAEGANTRITFLDCGRRLDTLRRFTLTSVGMSLLGFIVITFVVIFFSRKFIQPVSESYEKQKRFITDAGHEIKTPLTIICANADVLQMDIGENECLDDIRQQTERLTSLTNSLVYLAKMEESENKQPMIEFPLSEVVTEAAAPFKTVAQSQGKEFAYSVQPLLSMYGNDKAISHLVSILADNALKYSPKGSRISLNLEKQNRKLVLTVSNPISSPLSTEDLRHVFDRFYRADPSRNSQTGGHGIGLSMAHAIVKTHGGKITAASPDGKTFLITAALPLSKN